MSTTNRNDLPFVWGAGAGVVAWIVGYLMTYLVVAPSLNDSALNQLVEAMDGSLPTFDVVGWTFFNAHFVDTLVQGGLLMGDSATSFIGGDNGFTVFLYLVPAGLLVAAGLALARQQTASSPAQGGMVGLTVVPGYFLLSIAGAFLFKVTTLGTTVGPDIVLAALVAGIVYPVVFAGVGGALGGLLEQRASGTDSGL